MPESYTWSLPVYQQSIGRWSSETSPGTIQTHKTNSFWVQFQWNTDITKWDWNNLVPRSATLVSHILREGRRDFISVRERRRVATYILLKPRWSRSENGATKVGRRDITSYIWFRHIRVSLMTCWRAGLSHSSRKCPGGGGTPLYKPYRYVPPHRIGFLRRFGLKRVHILLILVWNRVWFLRNYGSVWTYLSFQFQMS